MTYLWLITAKLSVTVRKTLQPDRQFHVTPADNILYLKLGKLGVEAEFLYDASVLPRRETRVVFRLRTRDDHLARCEDERGRLRVANAHNDGRETLKHGSKQGSILAHTPPPPTRVGRIYQENGMCANLGIVLGVPSVQCNRLEVKAAVKIDCCHNVLKGGHDTLNSGDVLLLEGERYGSSGDDSARGRWTCEGIAV